MNKTEKIREACENGGLVDLTVGPMKLSRVSNELKLVPSLLVDSPKQIVVVMDMVRPSNGNSAPLYQTTIYVPKEHLD